MVILAVLQSIVGRLGQFAAMTGYEKLFDRLKNELVIAGIVSFGLFVYEQTSPDGYANWYEK
jgi:hypothetical protein